MLQVATEFPEDPAEGKGEVLQDLVSIAEETHGRLEMVVASSFDAFDANDPRPRAKIVQKEEICKLLKGESVKEVKINNAHELKSWTPGCRRWRKR